MERCAYVYILSSTYKKLYIGITNDIVARVLEHRRQRNPDSHTARYGIDQLVYFERFNLFTRAIAREKQLKGWTRLKKVALIVESNPEWRDLGADFGKAIKMMDES